MDIVSPLTFLAIDVESIIQPFIAFWVLVGMFVALMLPVLAIPYIFVKMGSVAGKVQAALNNTARGRNTVGKAARGAAGRSAERKAGQWAERGRRNQELGKRRGLRGTVGGYKTQRDFKRSQLSAEAKRLQEDALATRIQQSPSYAARAGGDHARAAAQAVIEKREREETENAVSQLRAAGIYHPDKLVQVAQGKTSIEGTKVGADGKRLTVDASTSPAMQRAATAQLVSAQDAASLETLVSSSATTDKQMVYEEIQKKYSDAKAAGAHLVKFAPGPPDASGRATGWSQETIKVEAAKALSSLSAEKLAGQDGPAAKSAVEGYKILLQEVTANPLPPRGVGPLTEAQAKVYEDREAVLNALRTLKSTAQAIDSNAQMKAKAKEGTRTALEEILTLPSV